MAADSYGTAHLWGVGTAVANATVESLSWDEERVNKGEVANENGNVIHRRYDDTHKTGQITLIMQSATTPPVAGSNITLNIEGSNVTFEVTKVGRSSEQKGFRKLTVDILKSEFVTS